MSHCAKYFCRDGANQSMLLTGITLFAALCACMHLYIITSYFYDHIFQFFSVNKMVFVICLMKKMKEMKNTCRVCLKEKRKWLDGYRNTGFMYHEIQALTWFKLSGVCARYPPHSPSKRCSHRAWTCRSPGKQCLSFARQLPTGPQIQMPALKS